jgi:hypothetical protein
MPVPAVRLKNQSEAVQRKPRLRRPHFFLPMGKLKPLYAVVNGKPEHHPEGVYNLRYVKASKRVWHAAHEKRNAIA